MNNVLRRTVASILAGVLLASSLTNLFAQTADLCQRKGILFGFFNGVQTTQAEADRAMQEFKIIHGVVSSTGERISYDVFYNYSNGLDDFIETFEQRLSEQDGLLAGRFELFFETLQGGGTWWTNITNAFSAAGSLLQALVDARLAQQIQQLATLVASPPTTANYAEHRLRIDNSVLEGRKLLFVAHSQGNLFANSAYSYARSKAAAESVAVVHIAPASPTLNGPHTLADLDLVINGLRATGTVASITDLIPGYGVRPAGLNFQRDALGHGLLEIYLNPAIATAERIKEHINAALAALVAPPTVAATGFFTATLTWNGTGDVDLHTFEPNSFHVFYRQMQGTSGRLDVDNTVANGPEHYYASCDASTLQTGAYQVAVANYSGASGRTATVQIASAADGVLGTRSVTLGPDTGDSPGAPLFTVLITQDQETGRFSAALAAQ